MIHKAVCVSLIAIGVTLSACEPKRIVTALPIPPERMDCAYVADRPTIPPEHVIAWQRVTTVAQARGEYDRFVASVRTREGVVSGYILKREGELFACANDAAFLREWNRDTTR